MSAAGLALGVAADAVLGDPPRWHPVAGFGRAAFAVETRVWRPSRAVGSAYAVGCVAVAALVGAVGDRVAGRVAGRAGRVAFTAVATWAVVGGRSLGREAAHLAGSLEAGDVAAARARLPALCGRDPQRLDAPDLARATVESVAENTSDAVVAPLLWGAVAGPAGLLGYRAVNTLDAMVGHRSERYSQFGWAAARLDDAANWLPARLTGLLAAALAPVVGGSRRDALRVMRRDGGSHPSPNAGRCEAAFAGALGVRLGGRNVYGDRTEDRPPLGDGRKVQTADVRRAVQLSTAVSLAATAGACCAAVVLTPRFVRQARGDHPTPDAQTRTHVAISSPRPGILCP
jgi:adenosylcobinamide-phosphate synthase